MRSKSIFWGLFFILLAVFVIATQTGSFATIGTVSVLAGFLLLMLAVYNLLTRNFVGMFVWLSLIYAVFRSPMGWPEISMWLLLFAAVLLGIGFQILFRKSPGKWAQKWDRHTSGFDVSHTDNVIENVDENNPQLSVKFGSSSKYLHSTVLMKGLFTVSFGEMKVFFDQAQLDPAGAEVFVDCSFGSLQLYIPSSWKVVNNIHASMGAVESKGRNTSAAEDAPRLTLNGNCNLGGIEIHYI